MLLAFLGLLGQTDLKFMDGYKNLISAVLTVIAVFVYALGGTVGGTVVWSSAPLMVTAATVSGYTGARFARRLPEHIVRYGIVTVGTVTTASSGREN